MTIQERLVIYKKALADFEAANEWTSQGLCLYLYKVHNLNFQCRQLLHELLVIMKPKNQYSRFYWFPKGQREPRIECLKKAIEITEQKIKAA